MKLNEYCEAKPSKIHGWGVFATKDIPKETDIIQYKGKVVSTKEGTKRSNAQDKQGAVYVFTLNNKQDVDGADSGNGAQFINYSCSPNSESINYDEEEIWIRAMKKIKKGEELSYDYGFDDENSCMCGSKNCRGKLSTNH